MLNGRNVGLCTRRIGPRGGAPRRGRWLLTTGPGHWPAEAGPMRRVGTRRWSPRTRRQRRHPMPPHARPRCSSGRPCRAGPRPSAARLRSMRRRWPPTGARPWARAADESEARTTSGAIRLGYLYTLFAAAEVPGNKTDELTRRAHTAASHALRAVASACSAEGPTGRCRPSRSSTRRRPSTRSWPACGDRTEATPTPTT